jgi:hypothetical protein
MLRSARGRVSKHAKAPLQRCFWPRAEPEWADVCSLYVPIRIGVNPPPKKTAGRGPAAESEGVSAGSYTAGALAGAVADAVAGASSALLISSIERPLVSKPSTRNISAACPYQKARNNRAGNSAAGTTLGLT